ncbi:MAG: hypothetical protein HY237_11415 [Acidobacteria bacterium]|nr:hypothetical protein [Acidobacteriota bacterium]
MSTNIIGRDQLEADAVVPQCLDNQYVSDEVFSYMMEHGADYGDRNVRAMREREVQTEFVRSLVYSSQVVINRVALKNNDYLYENYLPANREGLVAFSELLRQKAIVPFLYHETSLREESGVHERTEGARAVEAFLRETGEDITYVRLAVDDEKNRQAIKQLSTRFAEGVTRPRLLDPERRNAMAGELFSSPERLQEPGCWEAFNTALDKLANYSFQKAGELASKQKDFTRTDIYRDHFIVPVDENQLRDAITLGWFRKPGQDNPFLLEQKKLVDLVYNTNLPDLLSRYTFTPAGLPSRVALQDDPVATTSIGQLSTILTDAELLSLIRRKFIARAQEAMNLPLLHELIVPDVVELLRLPEWQAFKESQTRILNDPLRCLELLEPFQKDFDNFQRAMSDWYNKKYEHRRTEEKYVNFVTFALSIAGKVFVVAMDINNPLVKTAVDAAVGLIPKKVKGFAAKLMVSVYDVGRKRLDRERSYSLELMRTKEELSRKDVEDLINRISTKGEGVPADLGHRSAEQGKQ